MIVVTDSAGFIGSNIIKELNERGHSDIVVVDNLKNSDKFRMGFINEFNREEEGV